MLFTSIKYQYRFTADIHRSSDGSFPCARPLVSGGYNAAVLKRVPLRFAARYDVCVTRSKEVRNLVLYTVQNCTSLMRGIRPRFLSQAQLSSSH